jgi:MFS family permease
MPNAPHPSAASQHGLDWLNFFIADVETAFGPFVAVYLSTKGWGQGAIGTVITVNSAVALATQIPPGWLVDWTHYKRVVVAACLACIAAGSMQIVSSAGRRLPSCADSAARRSMCLFPPLSSPR